MAFLSWWPQVIGLITSQPRPAWQLMTQSQNHILAVPPYLIGPSLPSSKMWGHPSHLLKAGVSKNFQPCFKTAVSVEAGTIQQKAKSTWGRTARPSSLKGMVSLQNARGRMRNKARIEATRFRNFMTEGTVGIMYPEIRSTSSKKRWIFPLRVMQSLVSSILNSMVLYCMHLPCNGSAVKLFSTHVMEVNKPTFHGAIQRTF